MSKRAHTKRALSARHVILSCVKRMAKSFKSKKAANRSTRVKISGNKILPQIQNETINSVDRVRNGDPQYAGNAAVKMAVQRVLTFRFVPIGSIIGTETLFYHYLKEKKIYCEYCILLVK